MAAWQAICVSCHSKRKVRTGTREGHRRSWQCLYRTFEQVLLRGPEHVHAFSAIPVVDGGRRDEDAVVLTVLQMACTSLQDHGGDGAARKASVQSGSGAAMVFSLRVVSRMPRAQCKVCLQGPANVEQSSRSRIVSSGWTRLDQPESAKLQHQCTTSGILWSLPVTAHQFVNPKDRSND